MIDIVLPPWTSLELPDDVKASFVLLRESKFQVLNIHNLPIRYCLEEHERDYRASLTEASDLVLSEHLYNIRRVSEDWRSDHD